MTALFPDVETAEMLGIISNSGYEIRVLHDDVQEHVEKARDMLGHYANVEAAVAVCSEHTVARIDVSRELVEAAHASLGANWSGEAYLAYQAHASTVLRRMKDMGEQVQRLADEIGTVRDTIAGHYLAATRSLATFAAEVVTLAGGLGFLRPEVADRFRRLVEAFVTEVGTCRSQVITSLEAGRDVLSRVREVVAGLKAPELATVAAPAIAKPGAWRLKPGAPGGVPGPASGMIGE